MKPLKFSGTWYSNGPSELRQQIAKFMEGTKDHGLDPKLMIVPHAGLRFSGAVAAHAYRLLHKKQAKLKRLILLGPSHKHAFKGIAVPSHERFETPFASLPVDQDFKQKALALPFVSVDDAAFEHEHCLEMQWPFISLIAPHVHILPLIIGAASPAEVKKLLDAVWGGDETMILISSDLSHYHPYVEAQELDKKTNQMIETLQPQLVSENACGHRAINGALLKAIDLNMRVTGVDRRNSGDTAGPKDRVVGYASYVFEYPETARLTLAQRHDIQRVIQHTIRYGLNKKKMPTIVAESFSRPLRAIRGCFVTLTLNGKLRGCIGSPQAHQPLIIDVAKNAYKAAFDDHRFAPLTMEEVDKTEVSVSILSALRPMNFVDEADLLRQLKPHVEGLVIKDGKHNALFLPHVWESIPEPDKFLRQLKMKAKLGSHHWSDTMQAFSFTTETF